MLQQFLTDPASASLARSLDGYATRQRTVANNIANAETPGFVRSSVSFEADLRAALEAKDSSQAIDNISRIAPQAFEDESNPAKPDGNNVNLEQEISELSKTTLSYRAATVLMEIKGNMLSSAINGR